MYCRVVVNKTKQGVRKIVQRNAQKALEKMEKKKGFKSAFFLIDHEGGEYVSTSFWETYEQANFPIGSTNSDKEFVNILEQFPVLTVYEVFEQPKKQTD